MELMEVGIWNPNSAIATIEMIGIPDDVLDIVMRTGGGLTFPNEEELARLLLEYFSEIGPGVWSPEVESDHSTWRTVFVDGTHFLVVPLKVNESEIPLL